MQTPEFVEEFILDRTLTPALDEFGLPEVRLIDPTCGSGHFLLGAFHRLYDQWVRREPGTNPRGLVQRALDQVYGVDLNPFAVTIARFRLLVAALQACDVKRLADASGFHLNLAVGDSLLHGKRFRAIAGVQKTLIPEEDPLRHVYETEDAEALALLLGQQYQVVVGNPPYITVKDTALNEAYRDRYAACYRQYPLAAPFVERFFDLTIPGSDSDRAGFTGMIVANSFMKREFGKKLVEEILPRLDLTHVIDTSGAYVPGHGTPTVVLFGRHRSPVAGTIRAVQGIRGEPETPDDPARGLVWTAIVEQVDRPGSESTWVSASDLARSAYSRHPWSVGGGGASELKDRIADAGSRKLGAIVEAIGRTTVVGEDDASLMDRATAQRLGLDDRAVELGIGDGIRDWGEVDLPVVLYPYDSIGGRTISKDEPLVERHLWRYRATLENRSVFGKTLRDMGRPWYEHLEHYRDKLRTPLSIAFAFVATHNHFVLDRGGKLFNRTAPIIKLPPDATEDDHLALLGLLNSSVACFWMKQVFFPKAGSGMGRGIQPEAWMDRYEFDSTKIKAFPIPEGSVVDLARALDVESRQLLQALPGSWGDDLPNAIQDLDKRRLAADLSFRRMVTLQEELDWRCYVAYGIVDDQLWLASADVPPIELGWRAFEIDLARRVENGAVTTAWFKRHGSQPTSEIPAHLPPEYRELVKRRLETIRSDGSVRLIEQPAFKRRWNVEPWEGQLRRALQGWLAARIESFQYWPSPRLQSIDRLADAARKDDDFMNVAQCYRGHLDFDVPGLVAELVGEEAVPWAPVLRYKATGLRKHELWKRTWDLQRLEDAIDARTELASDHPDHLSPAEATAAKAREVGEIPVPPKYGTADYQTTTFWRHRGKLDVPKERFISFPHCERDADPSLVVGWAGWNHLEQARAIAACYLEMKEQEGWTRERLTPLLTALVELIPWVKQWHNEPDPDDGVPMGDYFDDFVDEEARALDLTREQIESWTPPGKSRGRKPRQRKTETEAMPA